MLFDISLNEALLVFDGGVFAVLVAGVALTEMRRPPKVTGSREAFELLERSIGSSIAGMPDGYSWGEALKTIKGTGVRADWDNFEKRLADYQAHRFGGGPEPQEDWNEVVRVALKLRRKKIAIRSQVKSPGAG